MSAENHDSKGRFVKGNTAAGYISPEFKELKKVCREDLSNAIYSLRKPWQTIKQDLENPNSTRWEYTVAKAISRGDTKFVQWLFEMVIGKPNQSLQVEENPSNIPHVTINIPDNGKSKK